MTAPTMPLALLAAEPWAIDPSTLEGLLAQARAGTPVAVVPRSSASTPRTGAIAVIPVRGIIEHRSSFFSEYLGGTSCEAIRVALRAAVADPAVVAVVLDIDSPGGTVAGITELAAELRAARSVKPVVAVANSLCASAAYWLASQASELIATPSGTVGSIGVIVVHLDQSRALDQAGITPTIISAGTHKADGNPLQPLADDARATLQRRVDTLHQAFLEDVARGRSKPGARITAAEVRERYGEGAIHLAAEARRLGLVDYIATLDQAIGALVDATQPGGARRSTRAAAEALPAPSEAAEGQESLRARWMRGAHLVHETATHEAAHAVVAATLGVQVTRTEAQDDRGGETRHGAASAEQAAIIAFAGPEATALMGRVVRPAQGRP